MQGRAGVLYVIIKTLICISVETRLQYLSRVVRFFDLSSFELHNLASSPPELKRPRPHLTPTDLYMDGHFIPDCIGHFMPDCMNYHIYFILIDDLLSLVIIS